MKQIFYHYYLVVSCCETLNVDPEAIPLFLVGLVG